MSNVSVGNTYTIKSVARTRSFVTHEPIGDWAVGQNVRVEGWGFTKSFVEATLYHPVTRNGVTIIIHTEDLGNDYSITADDYAR